MLCVPMSSISSTSSHSSAPGEAALGYLTGKRHVQKRNHQHINSLTEKEPVCREMVSSEAACAVAVAVAEVVREVR